MWAFIPLTFLSFSSWNSCTTKTMEMKSLWQILALKSPLVLQHMPRWHLPAYLLVRCDSVTKSSPMQYERKWCMCASWQLAFKISQERSSMHFPLWLDRMKMTFEAMLESKASLGLGLKKTCMRQSHCCLMWTMWNSNNIFVFKRPEIWESVNIV